MPHASSPYRTGITAFTVTLLVCCGLSALQFFYLYSQELLGKGLRLSLYVRLITFFAASVVPLVLVICMLAAGVFSGRAHFRSHGPPAFIRRFLVVAGCISVLGFVYNSFVVSEANYRALTTLYNVRNARTQQEYDALAADTANIRVFSGMKGTTHTLSNFAGLITGSAALTKAKKEKQQHIKESIAQTAAPQVIKPVLDSAHAGRYGLTMKDIPDNTSEEVAPGVAEDVEPWVEHYIAETQAADLNIAQFRNSIVQQVFYPVILFLLSITGLLLGYLYRRTHIAIPIIAFCLIMGALPLLVEGVLNRFGAKGVLPHILARLTYVALLSIFALIFFRMNRKAQQLPTGEDERPMPIIF